MNKQKKSQKAFITLIIAVLILGIVLAIAFASYVSTGNRPVIRAEITYIFIVLALLLPISMLILLLCMLLGKKRVVKDNSQINTDIILTGDLNFANGVNFANNQSKK